ncbi:hypothetical protein GCM10023081_09270 [Arthrobacter ginkgonis]|uniref:Uncharacterized protein n=1 Tax=Arthrobacter ginkgonis TaxID=1630594 RepID=A0ABP7BZU9_9MICC
MTADLEAIWGLAVAGFLCFWFGVSAFHQFRPHRWTRLMGHDVLGLIPRWSFFAPNPGRHDIHLVFRDWILDEPTEWQELDLGSLNSWTRWIWHPERYASKAVADAAGGLSMASAAARETGARTVMLSTPYLRLLSWAMSQPVPPDSTARQFAVIASQGFGPTQTLELRFLSEKHPFES